MEVLRRKVTGIHSIFAGLDSPSQEYQPNEELLATPHS
jgi:hypothetical protein